MGRWNTTVRPSTFRSTFRLTPKILPFRFQVDDGSELYYDPTPLIDSQKTEKPEDENQQSEFNAPGMSPTMSRNHQPPGYPYSPHVQRNYPGGPFGSIPPGQFYNGPGGDAGSPMRMMNHDVMGMGGMGMGMGMSPVGRRVTRGMTEEFGPM